jgi:hypothetical protein
VTPPIFFLGTHEPSWLYRVPDVWFFVSRRRLERLRSYKRAVTHWALDSGGFTELSMYGGWQTAPEQYIASVRKYDRCIGGMVWAAIQDWMCEPIMLARTGLSVYEHQRRTVANYLELRALAPDLPWVATLQGWEQQDYHRCVDMYYEAGVQLHTHPVVGVGSVCRRQHTDEAAAIFRSLHARGLALHGFGLKIEGLRKAARFLASSDSMAWSQHERREHSVRIRTGAPNPCGHRGSCANCLPAALRWRQRVLRAVQQGMEAT